MRTLLTALTLAAALAVLLGGCSKCDPWWGDRPGACQSALPGR